MSDATPERARQEAIARVHELLKANDAMDAAGVAAAFAADGVLQFANLKPARGRDQVRKSLTGFFSSLSGLRHEVVGVTTGQWEAGVVASAEAEVTYTRSDGSAVGPLPVTSTVRFDPDGLVARYQIYIDASPLYAPHPSDQTRTR